MPVRATRFARLSLALFGAVAVSSVWAADPAALADIANAQQGYYSDHGQSVPDEANLLAVINNAQLDAQFALIDQDQGVGNRATISQTGNANAAAALQGFGNDNLADISQTGAANYAVITQSGDGNHVDTLSQQGNNNYALVNQYNGNNALSLTQKDDYNRASIDQYGGTSLNVTQTNAGGSASSINDLSLKAYVEPGANSNFAPVTQSGPGQSALYLCNGSASYCSQVLPN